MHSEKRNRIINEALETDQALDLPKDVKRAEVSAADKAVAEMMTEQLLGGELSIDDIPEKDIANVMHGVEARMAPLRAAMDKLRMREAKSAIDMTDEAQIIGRKGGKRAQA